MRLVNAPLHAQFDYPDLTLGAAGATGW